MSVERAMATDVYQRSRASHHTGDAPCYMSEPDLLTCTSS
jgi:hypothetical protein